MEEFSRRDSLIFTFDAKFAKPKSFEFEDWLETVVKIPSDDVVGIYFSIVRAAVFVKLKSPELGEQIVASTGGALKYNHSDGNVGDVSISQAGFGVRTVRIFELPFEVPAERINVALAPYGKVLSNFAEKFSAAHKYPVLNGIRQVKIDLHKHIPSYVNVCGYRAIVMYDGQPKTCANCNLPGHVRAECIQRRITQLPRGESVATPTMTLLENTYAGKVRVPLSAVPEPETDETVRISNSGSPGPLQVTKTVAPLVGSEEIPQQTEKTPTPSAEPIDVVNTTPDVITEQQSPADLPTSDRPQEAETQFPSSVVPVEIMDTTPAVMTEHIRQTDLPTSDSGTDDASSKSSRKRSKKKRRLAHQNAEKTAPPLRQKARLISEQLSGKTSSHLISQDQNDMREAAAASDPTFAITEMQVKDLRNPQHMPHTPQQTAMIKQAMDWADEVESCTDAEVLETTTNYGHQSALPIPIATNLVPQPRDMTGAEEAKKSGAFDGTEFF